MDLVLQPWPWWISGILIGLTVPLLYWLTGQGFGISTSLQQMGAMCSPNSRLSYFKDYDRRKGLWTLMFAVGIVAEDSWPMNGCPLSLSSSYLLAF